MPEVAGPSWAARVGAVMAMRRPQLSHPGSTCTHLWGVGALNLRSGEGSGVCRGRRESQVGRRREESERPGDLYKSTLVLFTFS